MIRVLLADDHASMRDGMRLVLEGAGDITVVGTAADGREAIREIRFWPFMVHYVSNPIIDVNGDSAIADRLLRDVRNRWPEWSPAWLAHSMVLSAHGHGEEARLAMETATALGVPATHPTLLDFLTGAAWRAGLR